MYNISVRKYSFRSTLTNKSPTHSLFKSPYVFKMMHTVPRVYRQHNVQWVFFGTFRMKICTFHLSGRKFTEEAYPAMMNTFYDRKARGKVTRSSVLLFGPICFGITFYFRRILKQCMLTSEICMGMTICQVMNNLSNGPSTFSVWSL